MQNHTFYDFGTMMILLGAFAQFITSTAYWLYFRRVNRVLGRLLMYLIGPGIAVACILSAYLYYTYWAHWHY
jgi:hypothetical protein